MCEKKPDIHNKHDINRMGNSVIELKHFQCNVSVITNNEITEKDKKRLPIKDYYSCEE